MALYEYACDECGDFLAKFPLGAAPRTEICAGCGQARPRRYSMNPTQVMHEHWNVSAQQPISSRRQHADVLRRQSEEATERTGVPHDFQPVDVQELQSDS